MKHDKKPAESREMRYVFSNCPTTAQHWDRWMDGIKKLHKPEISEDFSMTRKLPNDRLQHSSKKLKLLNFQLLLKTASSETKVHRSDTELALRKE